MDQILHSNVKTIARINYPPAPHISLGQNRLLKKNVELYNTKSRNEIEKPLIFPFFLLQEQYIIIKYKLTFEVKQKFIKKTQRAFALNTTWCSIVLMFMY
jgi:hypothetical protein